MENKKTTTYKVWIEIEQWDELAGIGTGMDAPGDALAEFDSFEQAYHFAEGIRQNHAPDDDVFTVTAFTRDDLLDQFAEHEVDSLSDDDLKNLAAELSEKYFYENVFAFAKQMIERKKQPK